MRAIIDFRDNLILQVEKNLPIGDSLNLSGKYFFQIPEGANVRVSSSSVVLPYADPNSLITQSFVALLENYPQYNNILFNPLILDTDLDQLDLTGVLNEGGDSFVSRFQMGRGTGGVLSSGNAPSSVALLPQNNSVLTPKPGVLLSQDYDISIQTGGLGADNFMIYWEVHSFQTSPDIRAFSGLFDGQNIPAAKNQIELGQSLPELEVFISSNSGTDFFPVQRLTPTSLCSPTNSIKLGFKNIGGEKIYLGAYAILF